MLIKNVVRALSSFAFISCLSTAGLQAQTSSAIAALQPLPQANRVAANADLGPQTQLSNHLPVWAQPSAQVAKSPDLTQSMHVSIVLQRDPSVQAAFTQLLEAQQTPGSALYHQWLTPAQVGQLYGPTASDLAAVTTWLTSQGLTVESIAPSNVILEVTGTGAAMANAFHTSFGYFTVGADTRFSAISEPSIPTALTPVLQTIAGLSETHLMPQSHATLAPMSEFTQSRNTSAAATGGATPDYTYTAGSVYFMTPGDFDNIYDITSVIAGGNTGATIGAKAQHIAVIGRSRVTPTDVTQFESNTNTALGIVPNVIIPGNGVDPGYPGTSNPNGASAGDQGEATLDVDRTITTAPGAITDLIVSGTPTTGTLANDDGIYVSASWNVNSVVDPIMTISFGACEAAAGQSGVNLWDTLFSTAAAEGISVFVSSGDSGVDGCTGSFSPITKAYAASINYICSSSFATCVGGTEFNDASAYSTYWNASNATGLISAIGYIPEGAWNEPTTVSNNVTYYIPASSGGGPSLYITKPSWQTGITLVDSARDTPDIAFSAASHDGYYACLLYAGASCLPGQYFEYFSGTSAAAPSMAAIAALINTKAGGAEGNFSPVLYKAYAKSTTAFHDATVASSGVTSCTTATPSMCNNSVPNSTGLSTTSPGVVGYSVLTGYDLVTGLGSLDVAKFVATAASPTVSTTLALTTVSPNPATTNQTVTLTATLTPSSSTLGTPTGTVTFYSNGVAIQSVTIASNVGTITTSFPSTGTYAITATYSGDANYITSSATAVSLVVNTAPTFSLTPASSPITGFISGSTTGNTDAITVKSLNAFTGAVALGCTTSGITGATCSMSPTSVTLTSGGTATSTLTFNIPAGTTGTLTITVTGTSGSLSIPTTVVVSGVVASSFTLTAAAVTPTSTFLAGTAGITSIVTIASVNNFAGTVALSCTTNTAIVGGSSCTANPTSVTLVAGGNATTTVTLTTVAGSSGNLVATASGTGTTTGATTAVTAAAAIAATVTAPSFTASATAIAAINSGATTGNTSVVTFSSPAVAGYSGTVTTACAIAVTSGSPTYPATCSVSNASGSLTPGSSVTATLTIGSTVPHARQDKVLAGLGTWGLRGGAALLASFLFLPAIRRRRLFRSLAAFGLLAIGLASVSGCGGGGAVQTPPQGSTGVYAVTVTGTGTTNGYTTTASTTVSVTVN